MRRTISKKDKGRNRIANIGLVLVFALLLSISMTGGLLSPGTALATVAITDCGGCHIYPGTSNVVQDGTARNTPAGLFPGSHGTHAGTGNTPGNLQYGFACSKCHVLPAANNHRNGYIDMANPINGNTGAAYSRGTVSFQQWNTFTPGTCSGTYCHSNGTGGTLNAGDPRAIASSTSPTWGQTATCATCHGIGGDGSGQPTASSKANSHASHLPWNTTVSCYVCHSATVSNTSTAISNTSNHVNGIYNLSPVGAPTFTDASFTYAYSTSGGTCATNYCHGGQTPKWGAPNSSPTGDWDCIGCHSYSFPKRLGSLTTIRKVVGAGGDFNMSLNWATLNRMGASRHLYGASTIVKWDCIVCHREGRAFASGPYAAGAVNWVNHNDSGGLINLRNVDTVNETVGWAINNVNWTTTDYTNLDQFCITCHDSNGAAAVSVNAANNGIGGNGLTPFNSTDVVGGYLKGSTWFTGSERLRVTNVKDQFYPGTNGPGPTYNGNPSQHAVLGRRYSTISNTTWGITAANWNNYVLKKTGVNVNVSKETSLLTCADCHVLDVGSGAHGGSTPYNLQWTTGLDSVCWRCHGSTVYNTNTAVAGSRWNHAFDSPNWGATNYGAYGFANGATGAGNSVACLLCHASWNGTSTVSRQYSYGGIHGSWSSVAWYTTSKANSAYRFMPGAYFRIDPPGAGDSGWNTGSGSSANCYFYAAGQRWTNCTSHTGSGSSTIETFQYNRPVKY